MNRRARAGSTGFQVMPSTLRLVPTITPSATARVSASRSAVTPVFASTGVCGAACLAARRSLMANGTPASGPLMRITSRPRKLALRARSATVRVPIVELNSGVMLPNRATSDAPIASR